MTRDEIVALCKREAEAWNAHDPAAVAAVYAEDATLHDAGGETARGRDAIAARTKLYMDAFPDMRLDVESIEVDGNRFTLEWKASGTNTGSLAGLAATSKSVVVEGCDVAEVGDDGLVRREIDYWNEASLMRQLGLMPEPAATA
jgi:steroid delta-isomerase-like uncharacterized protein